MEDSPDVHDAVRLAADRLDLPADTQAGLMPRGRAKTGTVSRKVLEFGARLERGALAACIASPELVVLLGEMSADHFDSDKHRRVRQHLVEGTVDEDATALRAGLDARTASEGIDLRT